MPTILITGKNGQVGFELQRSLSVLGDVVAVGRATCDLSQPATIRQVVQQIKPDIIVNAAAYTAVDKAEAEVDLAHAVNANGPEVLAIEAAKIGALLVHYSTDYVFDGRKVGPYTEQDAPNPQSVYGQTKLAGENAIRAAHDKYLIFRISWIFGVHGSNFLKTVLRLAKEREDLKVVADQYGAPTIASLIADVTAQILGQYLQTQSNRVAGDLYHLSAGGETTWHGFAQAVLQHALALKMPLTAGVQAVEPIPTAAYPLPAPRPANSRLDTSLLRRAFGLVLPDWRAGVEQAMALLHDRSN